MYKTMICRRVPVRTTSFHKIVKMLIFQKQENGSEVVVGSVTYDYDWDDCTDVEITYGKGTIFYRELSIPSIWRHPFTTAQRDIAMVLDLNEQVFLQLPDQMLQVRRTRVNGQPGTVELYTHEPLDGPVPFRTKRVLQICPQARGEELFWSAEIPASYPAEIQMILATLPLTANSFDYVYEQWKDAAQK